jgi:hypothetical protein
MCCVLTEDLSYFIDSLAYNSIYVTVMLPGDEEHKRHDRYILQNLDDCIVSGVLSF